MSRRSTATTLFTLSLLASVSPIATDSYLSSFPAMADSLHTAPASIQLSLTAFLLGFGAAQFALGSLSDALGRRTLLIAGPLAFALTSLLCIICNDALLLAAARVLQGAAASAAVVAARASVMDNAGPERAARHLGFVTAVGALVPMVSPWVGNAISTLFGWRAVFLFMAAVGFLYALMAALGIKESLPTAMRHGRSATEVMGRFGEIFRRTEFVKILVPACLVYAGHVSYVSSSSFVFQGVLGMSAAQYSTIFTINAGGMVAASLVFMGFGHRIGPHRALRWASGTAAMSAGVLLATMLLWSSSFWAVWVCLFVCAGAMGVAFGASTTMCQIAGRPFQGTAAAIQGGCQFLAGAMISPVTGLVAGESLLVLTVLLVALHGTALTVAVAWRPRLQR